LLLALFGGAVIAPTCKGRSNNYQHLFVVSPREDQTKRNTKKKHAAKTMKERRIEKKSQ